MDSSTKTNSDFQGLPSIPLPEDGQQPSVYFPQADLDHEDLTRTENDKAIIQQPTSAGDVMVSMASGGATSHGRSGNTYICCCCCGHPSPITSPPGDEVDKNRSASTCCHGCHNCNGCDGDCCDCTGCCEGCENCCAGFWEGWADFCKGLFDCCGEGLGGCGECCGACCESGDVCLCCVACDGC